MMDGRWTIRREWDDSRVVAVGPVPDKDEGILVVPCDEAAVERASRVVRVLLGPLLGDDEEIDAIVRGVFLAAKAETLELRGETP
jgi:hypothetical protein